MSTSAKVRTSAKDKAVAKLVTKDAKVKTIAKVTADANQKATLLLLNNE